MIEYYTNINNFWKDDLANHDYAREVPFVAKNFDHLNRKYYNKKDYLLQSFNEELPNADRFKGVLDVHTASVSWTCIQPNVILPTHKDTFYTLRQEHNVELDDCYRYLIFLEDWIFGHYVGFENENITHWKAGDVWKFTGYDMHYGVNASNVPFHTAQVSTFK
jgi:hypothetical protein